MSDGPTSLSLIEKLRNPADDESWRRFQDLYGPLIQRCLVRRGVVGQDADDVAQEVLTLLVAELPKFQHNGRTGALRAWLRQVVANRLKTFWRQRNRQAAAAGGTDYQDLAAGLADPNSQLSRIWDEEYRRDLCQRLLDLVEDEFRDQTMQAFRGVALEGRRAAEVGKELDMSPNAVRIAQSRVMRRLRELGEGLLD